MKGLRVAICEGKFVSPVRLKSRQTEQDLTAARRIPPAIVASALRKLDMLNATKNLQDLRSPPGNRLERLLGDLAGFHSIRINDQWRVVFRWEGTDAHDVRIADYH